jgi:hypothetical protein
MGILAAWLRDLNADLKSTGQGRAVRHGREGMGRERMAGNGKEGEGKGMMIDVPFDMLDISYIFRFLVRKES